MTSRNYFFNTMPVYAFLLGCYVFVFRKLSRWNESEILLGFVSAGQVLFVWLAHGGVPVNDLQSIPPEVFPRLFLQATPPLLLFFSSRLGRQTVWAQTAPNRAGGGDCGPGRFSV